MSKNYSVKNIQSGDSEIFAKKSIFFSLKILKVSCHDVSIIFFCTVIEFTLIFSYFDNFQPGEYVLYKNKDYEVEVGPIVRAAPQITTVIISIKYDSLCD